AVTFLFGPRLIARNPLKINPFVQAVFGGSHLTRTGFGSSNQFAYSFGGGVDIGMLPHLYFRPQVDYVGLRNSGQTLNCTRVSAGVAIRFCGRPYFWSAAATLPFSPLQRTSACFRPGPCLAGYSSS